MSIELDGIEQQGFDDLKAANTLAELEEARVKHLGRKSGLTEVLRRLKDLSPEERAQQGSRANEIRQKLEDFYNEKRVNLEHNDIEERMAREAIDVTAPGLRRERGHLHPLTLVRQDVERIFHSMGFSIMEGPEIESEWYNFDALNVPKDHPARDMQDTFWLKQTDEMRRDSRKHLLPRTHTSAVQVRYMEKHQPPFRIIVPGRAFRNEATDATHEMQFHTFEGLMVGKDVSLANLKGILEHFARRFFKDDIEVRFVASYFPYTEPSVEVFMKGKKGKLKDRWIEVAGAGMVHQKVFEAAGYVPGEYQGFAFGMTIDRLAMFKYGIDDIRLFYGSDLRFLNQF